MLDIIKGVIDANGTLSISDDVYAVGCIAILVLCFTLVIKFLLDVVRAFFPSIR